MAADHTTVQEQDARPSVPGSAPASELGRTPSFAIRTPPMPAAFVTELEGADRDPSIIYKAGRARRKLYRSLAVLGGGTDGEVRLVECLVDSLGEENHRNNRSSTTDTKERRKAAMKIIPKPNVNREMKVQARRATIPLIAAVSEANAHIPRWIDIFEDELHIYAIWELLACPLSAYIARHGGKPGEEDVLNVLAGVVSAVATLHSLDLVHRDLKPANLMLRDGTLVICRLSAFVTLHIVCLGNSA